MIEYEKNYEYHGNHHPHQQFQYKKGLPNWRKDFEFLILPQAEVRIKWSRLS